MSKWIAFVSHNEVLVPRAVLEQAIDALEEIILSSRWKPTPLQTKALGALREVAK